MTILQELDKMISGTVLAYQGQPKQLRQALQAIQWRLVDADRRSVCLGNNLEVQWCAFEDGIVFDGRDNQAMKLKFYSVLMKTPLTIELLPQLCES